MISRDVVIVGSGPAGAATALHLLKADPTLAGEVLLLDKAVHPREKVCAGGLIPHTLDCLNELDIPLTAPHVRVNRASVRLPSGPEVTCEDGGMCSVVRRDEFDFSLVRAARERGVEVREGEKVLQLVREPRGVVVETAKETYRARVVVGADGSGSRVRRQLVGGENPAAVGRAIMCDVPVDETTWDGFLGQRYDFNFLPVAQGLRGYLWEFPCLIGGVPHVNVGIYTLGGSQLSNTDLQRLLAEELTSVSPVGSQLRTEGNCHSERSEESQCRDSTEILRRCAPQNDIPQNHPDRTLDSRRRTLDPRPRFRAFPIYGYAPGSPLAAPRVVLAGDAAGAEPLMGEGISFAFEYGKFAAHAVAAALGTGRYDFADYTENFARSRVGKKLRRLDVMTRCFYGRTWRVWFTVAARSRRLQSLGLKWYNGVDAWHQRSGWEALWTVLRPRSS